MDNRRSDAEIFGIVELFENILLQLPVRWHVLTCQRVSYSWYSVIESSEVLQRHLFLDMSGKIQGLNPLLEVFLPTHYGPTSYNEKRPHWKYVLPKFPIFCGSWQRMYISNPPATLITRLYDRHYHEESSHPLTLGDLSRAITDMQWQAVVWNVEPLSWVYQFELCGLQLIVVDKR